MCVCCLERELQHYIVFSCWIVIHQHVTSGELGIYHPPNQHTLRIATFFLRKVAVLTGSMLVGGINIKWCDFDQCRPKVVNIYGDTKTAEKLERCKLRGCYIYNMLIPSDTIIHHGSQNPEKCGSLSQLWSLYNIVIAMVATMYIHILTIYI